MSDIAAAARSVALELDSLGIRYALIGGFAVSVRSEPRFTQDLDLAIAAADDAMAERTVRDFLSRGYTALAIVEHETQSRLATVRLGTPNGTEIIDLLFASSGIEAEIADQAEPLHVLPGLRLRVARVGHLIALKLLARDDTTRPQDAADLQALVTVVDDAERRAAEEAVGLIHDRGYARGRDLRADLEKLLHEGAG